MRFRLRPEDQLGVICEQPPGQPDANTAEITPVLFTNDRSVGKVAVLIRTLGRSPIINGLVMSGQFNADTISGKGESFIITTITRPMPGIDQALVIAGSD